ncbi:MAG: metallophosphoesterase [Rubrivivax sp.]|nr:MAG: metallophosphoesterase [Rubrivivax sp.]
MRVFAVSDIHVDYDVNARWVQSLSLADYRDDVLILAGDVSDSAEVLAFTVQSLARRFKKLLFVPGNHDLWVLRHQQSLDSLEKFELVRRLVNEAGGLMTPWSCDEVAIVPLFAWYDFSFGQPGLALRESWVDFRACRWPAGFTEAEVTRHFLALNQSSLSVRHDKVITFSHFLPRIDVMPHYIPEPFRALYPVLGSSALDGQVRALNPLMHVYGHSHVNRSVVMDGLRYVNNAFGYPGETRIAGKRLQCIFEPF